MKSTTAKWIWGILAVIVIAFTIYACIDAIVKNRRKPKDLSDLLISAMKEEVKKPDFQERMEAAANRRNILFDGQRPNDEDFGYSLENPIMTSTISSTDEYLKKLVTLDGKHFTWERTGSYSMREIHGVSNVMVDAYQLYLDGKEYSVIYICPYGHNSTYTPNGMKIEG